MLITRLTPLWQVLAMASLSVEAMLDILEATWALWAWRWDLHRIYIVGETGSWPCMYKYEVIYFCCVNLFLILLHRLLFSFVDSGIRYRCLRLPDKIGRHEGAAPSLRDLLTTWIIFGLAWALIRLDNLISNLVVLFKLGGVIPDQVGWRRGVYYGSDSIHTL